MLYKNNITSSKYKIQETENTKHNNKHMMSIIFDLLTKSNSGQLVTKKRWVIARPISNI